MATWGLSPFTLAIEAPDLAGEESTNYAVTAFYDEFNESPNDRLAGPSTPLAFDEGRVATVTIGSAGTGADVTTWIAPGPVSDDASLINNIEVPEGAEAIAVETVDGDMAGTDIGVSVASGGGESGEFTEVETV